VVAAKVSASDKTPVSSFPVSVSHPFNPDNYFELFGLPVSCEIETDRLEAQYRTLQAEHHPDRVSSAEDQVRLEAMQRTSIVNDAYETLKSPLKKAGYLLKLAGMDPEEHNQAHLQGEFLIRQMEARESLERLIAHEDMDGLEVLKSETLREQETGLVDFASCYDNGKLAEAKQEYNKLQFLYKLLAEIDQAEEKLLDY